MFKILVVEDDVMLNKMISSKLNKNNFEVFSAFDGNEALTIMDEEYIDLIITDIMMPKMDGIALTKALRDSNYDLPILMVTAKGELDDMEEGFRVGSDDYLVKPIKLKELIMRVNALLRRAKIAHEKKLTIGDLVLDYDALTVTYKEDQFEMPKKEFFLLYKLLVNPNKIFTRLDLLDEIWGMDTESDERSVDAHIKKLRRKFELLEEFEIVTVRGLGYKGVIKKGR